MLRLVSGSSDDDDCFTHRARTVGAVSTVGASLGCDWTVRAAGVPSVAFALREDGGTLAICPAPHAAVFVNGRRELPLWRSLRVGSRVDVGLLRIEVVNGTAQSAAHPTVPAARSRAEGRTAPVRGGSLPPPSLLGAAEDDALDRLPSTFPWAVLAALTASAALYALTLNVLD